jgi:hypothetical protein
MYARETRVPVAQSRAEIERLLEKHKAKQYGTAVDYEVRQARVQFRLHDRIVRFVIALPDAGKLRGERLAKADRRGGARCCSSSRRSSKRSSPRSRRSRKSSWRTSCCRTTRQSGKR